MVIEIGCLACGKRFDVPDDTSAKSVYCPECGGAVIIDHGPLDGTLHKVSVDEPLPITADDLTPGALPHQAEGRRRHRQRNPQKRIPILLPSRLRRWSPTKQH